jgi:hypothetical protein
VQSISSKAQVAQMAAQSTIKLATVRTYMDEDNAAAIIAGHYGEPAELARIQMVRAEVNEMRVGF